MRFNKRRKNVLSPVAHFVIVTVGNYTCVLNMNDVSKFSQVVREGAIETAVSLYAKLAVRNEAVVKNIWDKKINVTVYNSPEQ